MGKKSRRDAKKMEEAQAALAAAKAAEAKATRRARSAGKAEEAKDASTTVSEPDVPAAKEVVAVVTTEPVAVDVREVAPAVSKPKKARFVREKKAIEEKRPPAAEITPTPRRNTTAAGKMMSKNLTLPPKEERSSGPNGQRPFGPKPRG
jgi:hypothetical protein